MNDIRNLSDDEVRQLCSIIGIPALKQFYKKCSKLFAKIAPGFRVNSLTADKIIDLTVKNRNQDIIIHFLSTHKDMILNLERQQEFARRIDLQSEIAAAESTLADLKRDCSEWENKMKAAQRNLEYLNDCIEQNKKTALATSKHYRAGQADLFVEPIEDMFAHDPDFVEYLWTAYDENIPLLLAGPKAHKIADALSIDLTATTAAIFDCAGVNSLDDLEICALSKDKIIALINPFAPNFIAYIPELLSITEKYFIALHPFAEDLRLEPRGLYNYFLPVPTEKFLPKDPHQQLRREAIERLKNFWEAAE